MSNYFFLEGDYHLEINGKNGDTYFTAVRPVEGPQQVKADSFKGNDAYEIMKQANEWEGSRLVDKLYCVLDEKPIKNLDTERLGFAKVHTLILYYSEEDLQIEVGGRATFEHRNKLADLDLEWNNEKRRWEGLYEEDFFEEVKDLVVENNHSYNPFEIGYEKCGLCNRFKPVEATCNCNGDE